MFFRDLALHRTQLGDASFSRDNSVLNSIRPMTSRGISSKFSSSGDSATWSALFTRPSLMNAFLSPSDTRVREGQGVQCYLG